MLHDDTPQTRWRLSCIRNFVSYFVKRNFTPSITFSSRTVTALELVFCYRYCPNLDIRYSLDDIYCLCHGVLPPHSSPVKYYEQPSVVKMISVEEIEEIWLRKKICEIRTVEIIPDLVASRFRIGFKRARLPQDRTIHRESLSLLCLSWDFTVHNSSS